MAGGTIAETFDPDRLTPLASLNNVRLVVTREVPLPPDLAGRTAYQLLSAGALAADIRARAAALGIDARDADDDTVLRHFDRALVAPDPAIRAAARTLAEHLGDRLGALLVTLLKGDAVSRAARPEWGDGHWAHWAAVTTIYLGGGLVSGQLGRYLEDRTAHALRRAGVATSVRRADWPALLPLLGAARAVPQIGQSALVFDFGQSFVKRACARYASGELARLHLLPAVPIRAVTAAIGAEPPPARVRELAEHLLAIIANTWHAASGDGWELDPIVVLSVASYIDDGQPLPRRGSPYGALHTLSPRLSGWLAERLQAHLGSRPDLLLLHDSSAAALAVPYDPHAAVIMLGTALGVGFPSSTRALRPFAADFTVLAGDVRQAR